MVSQANALKVYDTSPVICRRKRTGHEQSPRVRIEEHFAGDSH
jgi:hypothetical protein